MPSSSPGPLRVILGLAVAYIAYYLVVNGAVVLVGILGVVFMVALAASPALLAAKVLTRSVEYGHRRPNMELEPEVQHRLFADHFRREDAIEGVDTWEDGRPCVRVSPEYRRDRLWRAPVPLEVVAGDYFATVLPKTGAVSEGESVWLTPHDQQVRELRSQYARTPSRAHQFITSELVHLKAVYRTTPKPTSTASVDPDRTRAA